MKKLFLTVLCAITLGVIGDRCEATIYDVTRGGDFTVIGPFDSQDLLDTLSVTVLETPYIPPRPLDPCPTRLHLPGPRGTSRIWPGTRKNLIPECSEDQYIRNMHFWRGRTPPLLAL
jgi:hypothetical protein